MRHCLFRLEERKIYMYRLVVVDDEQAIRKGMCNYIAWDVMGFQVDADFEDGKETIEYLKDHQVDVLMTDIEMAEVSGLELARYVWENHLPVKVVILSGYREFEYARKAIEYNVEHYLLKPIRIDELQQVFGKIKKQLDESRQQQEKQNDREREFQEFLPELQEQFWISLLVGGLRYKEKIMQKKELLCLDFDLDKPCAIVDVTMEINPDMSQMYYQQRDNRYNLLNNIFGADDQRLNYHPVYLTSDILKVIVTTHEEMSLEEFQNCLTEQLQKKKEAVSMLLTLEMGVSVEEFFSNMLDLAEHKYSLQMHVKEKDGEKIRLVQEDHDRLQQKYRLLMQTIDDSDFDALEGLVESLFFEFRKFPLEELKRFLVDMFSMLSRKFMKMSTELWQDVKAYMDYQQIMAAEDKKAVKHICLEMLRKTNLIMESHQNQVTRSVVDRAMQYMREHYNEELSLEILADHYYLNPTYFSRIFRQYAGETFTDYLMELRMTKAQELLLMGKYRIYEVSQMVGYKSDKYFCRAFKQYTKLSPTEYCRNRNVL